MTRSVTDEILGKIARRQNDLFRRVREGTLQPDEVSRGLQDLIEGRFGGTVVAPTYPVTVNYDLPVEDAVKAGLYDWVDSAITSHNFPTERKGVAEVVVDIIHLKRHISTEDALKELDKIGYRPAELHDLLALGEKYPDLQREFPVVALGSVWQYPNDDRRVPNLGGRGSERHLNLNWFKVGWHELYRFAAVPK